MLHPNQLAARDAQDPAHYPNSSHDTPLIHRVSNAVGQSLGETQNRLSESSLSGNDTDRQNPKKPIATKNQLQALWEKEEITPLDFQDKRWQFFAKDWNKKNADMAGYTLPLSPGGIIARLGGDTKKHGKNIYKKDYIIALFKGEEYKEKIQYPVATKEQILHLWKQEVFSREHIRTIPWKAFASDWNKKNAETLGYALPSSLNSLQLRIETQKIVSHTMDRVISLLEGRECVQEIPLPETLAKPLDGARYYIENESAVLLQKQMYLVCKNKD